MPVNKKSKINNLITWLHLWLGLVSGIVVVIVSITGCLFVFQQEISDWVRHDAYYVTPPAGHAVVLPVSELKKSAQKALGADKPVQYITAYNNPDRAWEFMSYKPGNPKALTYSGSIDYYQSVFVNPYTGTVTGKVDYTHDFFVIVKAIHWSLYLSNQYGQPIVGWGTLIFVLILITGFIMWIPKRWTKAEKNKAFKVKWTAKFKRLNYDLHNILGFYTLIVALILAFTGMMYAFQWFNKAVYATATLSASAPVYPDFSSGPGNNAASILPLNRAYMDGRARFPEAVRYLLIVPATDKAAINVIAYPKEGVYYASDAAYYDQYSGKFLGESLYKNENNGQKLLDMKYDIHVGAIGGLAGKIIAFLVSLVCASLPVTGFIIWWGRKKKKGKKKAGKANPKLQAERIPAPKKPVALVDVE